MRLRRRGRDCADLREWLLQKYRAATVRECHEISKMGNRGLRRLAVPGSVNRMRHGIAVVILNLSYNHATLIGKW